MSEELAKVLFDRASSFLLPIEVAQTDNLHEPFGVPPDMLSGTWVPTGLNPCFRVCRYEPGGFFQPHYDHGFDYDRTHRSIKTFMVYLNDEFTGGPTTFYSEDQERYAEPDRNNALYDFQPEAGACIVFNHNMCHDGGVLKTGRKYILRSEVMYELVHEEASSDGNLSDGSLWDEANEIFD